MSTFRSKHFAAKHFAARTFGGATGAIVGLPAGVGIYVAMARKRREDAEKRRRRMMQIMRAIIKAAPNL